MAEPPPSPAPAAFGLRPTPVGRAILHLKSWGPVPPTLADLASIQEGARPLALGPREWLLVGDGIEGSRLLASLAPFARSCGLAAVDLSDGMAGLELEGCAARDILSTACGLDLHPRAFTEGSCTRTRLAQLPVVIARPASARYELYVGSSYAAYLEAWLRDAGSMMQS